MNPTHTVRHPRMLAGSPVLESVMPVIDRSRDVHTHNDKIVEVANWMAYEDLPVPDYVLPLGFGGGDPGETVHFILTISCGLPFGNGFLMRRGERWSCPKRFRSTESAA